MQNQDSQQKNGMKVSVLPSTVLNDFFTVIRLLLLQRIIKMRSFSSHI